jgi:hypothetical protein
MLFVVLASLTLVEKLMAALTLKRPLGQGRSRAG